MKKIIIVPILVLMIMSCSRTADSGKQGQVRSKDSVLKIACLGASNTEGYQIPDVINNSWPGQLQTMAGPGWKVLNAGCGGTTIMEQGNLPYRISLAYKQATKMEPDVAIFDFGWNDMRPMNRPGMEENFVKDYNALIAEFASMPTRPRLFLILPPLYETPHNNKAADYAILEGYYRQILSDNEITPIDLHATMSNMREFYNDDLVHYSVKGCAHAAAQVYEAITRELK